MVEKILFYRVKGEKYGCFSNFSKHQLIYEGKAYNNSEAAYQSAKFTLTEPDYAEQIRLTTSPKDAANLGRDKTHKMREDWEEVKYSIMKKVVKKKFETHPGIKKILLDTKGAELIENSPSDKIWGIGSDGRGENWLGKILMEVRDEFRKDMELLT